MNPTFGTLWNGSSIYPYEHPFYRGVIENPSRGFQKTKALRVEIDSKSLTLINHSDTPDVRALMNRKFGAERIGTITPICPGSPEASCKTQ